MVTLRQTMTTLMKASELQGAQSSCGNNRDPYRAYRFVGNAFALIIIAASVLEFVTNALHPTARDFISFWGAAQLALAGHSAAAYDNQVLHAVQSAVASFGGSGAQMPFPYPTAYLALVTPFGLLPFPIGMAVWTACTFAFYMLAARRLMPQAGWLPAALPAVYANAAVGQNAFLTAGIFMTGLSLMRRSPFVAGLVLGCLVIKPQLGLLLPVAFLAARSWRVIAGAALSSAALLVAGALVFGLHTTTAWLDQLPLYGTITRDGLVGWSKLSSVYALARALGVSLGTALVVHGSVAAASAVAVWRIWRSDDADDNLKIAILSAATAVASPYFFFYDMVVLAPAMLYLMVRGERPWLIFALWALPLLQIAQIATVGTVINLNALMSVALTVLIYVCWRLSVSAGGPGLQPATLKVAQPS